MEKKILGLDLGTNSIGWAVIENDWNTLSGKILGTGSRIIPMDAGSINKFAEGNPESKAKARTTIRSARRLKHRYKLRRTRLIQIFKIYGWFPEGFPENFKSNTETFNINNYIPFSQTIIDEAKKAFGHQSIPTDWIVYYLRKKALTERIELSELARIIYLLNQRRGYKSQRSENETEIETEEKWPKKKSWFEILNIQSVLDTGEKSRNIKVFQIDAINAEGKKYSATICRNLKPLWEGKNKEIEILETTTKKGEITYAFTEAQRSNWKKNKEAIEKDIDSRAKYIGEYFFESLQKNPLYRVREQVIDRSFYKKEFEAIWNKQLVFYHKEMNDAEKIKKIALKFYKHNTEKQKELLSNDLKYIIQNEILFFQRSLKSQKHTISECRYEKKNMVAANGKAYGIKVAPCSSPEFQEFRIWQTIHNLKVFNDDSNSDLTNEKLTIENKEKLFELFDNHKEVTVKSILSKLGLIGEYYRLNYPSDKPLLGNETKALIYQVFKRAHLEEEGKQIITDPKKLYLLWHILYSLPEENHVIKALKNKKNNFNLSDEIIIKLAQLKQIKGPYAAYSSLAIKKLLPIMRCGKYYHEEAVHKSTLDRIDNILTGEINDQIDIHARENIQKHNPQSKSDFQGLPTFLACYVVYGRHSERNETKYTYPEQMQIVEHGNMRNPVVEQVVNETIRLVQEAWKKYGQFDEIHIELARELKKNNQEKQEITKNNTNNEIELKRIKEILKELNGANPDSSTDVDRLRLWEETASNQDKGELRSIFKKQAEPTKSEIERYKLWGEQNCISPYTGRIIPLSKLFNKTEYEIDHIIPRSRFFDDSIANKTVCETAINKFKDNRTAMQLIIESGGQLIKCGNDNIPLFTKEEFENNIKRTFNGKKKRVLLTEEIPSNFIERQLNDTRYISRKIGELLHPAVKNELIFTTGSITNDLKEKWGLHRTWKRVLEPRFKRLEEITGEVLVEFDSDKNDIHFKKDYKRIDHRHHALDALIIACTSREHIRYLNTLNAQSQNSKEFKYLVGEKVRSYKQPWAGFEHSVKIELEKILVSHKNRIRLLTKGFNQYSKYEQSENGIWKKNRITQTGNLTSVRVSMFKQPLGIVKIKEYIEVSIFEALKNPTTIADRKTRKAINKLLELNQEDTTATLAYLKKHPLKDADGNDIKKIRVFIFTNYSAKRVTLDKSFTEDKIDKIPYATHSPMAKALREHLLISLNDKGKPDPNIAFTGEGLELLYKKLGYPLKKITNYEPIGTKRNIDNKLLETDKGSNLFFVIKENLKTGKREGNTLHLIDAIERLSKGLPITETPDGYKTIILSPGDFVYVPRIEETIECINWNENIKLSPRLFKMVSCTEKECHFLLHTVSTPIENKKEFGSLNKIGSFEGTTIQSKCIKVKIDMLGNISPM